MKPLSVLRQRIRENRSNWLASTAAVLCEKFLRAYYNEDFYSFEKNGEERVLALVSSWFSNDGFTAWDVGANKGDWTQAVLDARPDAKVICFEIVPHTAAKLKARFSHNPNVSVFDFGLSSRRGELNVCWNKSYEEVSSINPRLSHPLFLNGHIENISCKVETGDNIIGGANLMRVDMLKIDVEGHEMDVIRGFHDTFEKGDRRPSVIQFEYGATYIPNGHTLFEIYEYLKPLGYTVGRVYPRYVDFKDYEFSDEHFRMGNYVAVQSNSQLRNILSRF